MISISGIELSYVIARRRKSWRILTLGIIIIDCTELLIDCLDELLETDASVILAGDFNFPKINWHSELPCQHVSGSSQSIFVNFVTSRALYQGVKDPTRSDNILDLVLTNDPFAVFAVECDEPFSTSDHNMVSFQILYRNSSTMQSLDIYNYGLADWDNIRSSLNDVDWSDLFSDCENGDDMWIVFHSKLFQLIDLFVPKQRKYFAKNHSSGLYYSKKISKLQSHKLLCWRKYKRFKTVECKVRYNDAARAYRQAIVDHVRNKEEAVINSNNLGKFFNLANRKFASKSGIGPVQSDNGIYCTDPAEKAAILGDFFSSVFTVDDNSMPIPEVNSSLFPDGLNNIVFDRMRVLKVMNKLKVGSAGGPDNLKPIFLKSLANELAGPLSHIIEILFHSGCVPSSWKLAHITPVFKKGIRLWRLTTDPCL